MEFGLTIFIFFIESFNRNQIIDILYVTDLGLPRSCNESHSVFHISFEEVKKLIKSKFPFYVNLDFPRKLCYLKPLYGVLFEEHIKDYDFWAFGDLDNLLPVLLDQNDILTFHDTWLSGPLTIFRNENSVNKIYEKSKDLENIFENPKYVSFDEFGYAYGALSQNESILDIERKIDCMFYLFSK